jgi:hypothetical protein
MNTMYWNKTNRNTPRRACWPYLSGSAFVLSWALTVTFLYILVKLQVVIWRHQGSSVVINSTFGYTSHVRDLTGSAQQGPKEPKEVAPNTEQATTPTTQATGNLVKGIDCH